MAGTGVPRKTGPVPVVEAVITVPVPPAVAFAVSQTVAPVRYRWDPFVREQYFTGGATAPGRGVRTFTRSRHGFTMTSEYVSYAPPSHVGMKMVEGPWFFAVFAGGWRFAPTGDGQTVATWRYNFQCRPRAMRPLAHLLGRWLLGRDIRRRIAGYAAGCADPVVLAAARAVAERDEARGSRPAAGPDGVPGAQPAPAERAAGTGAVAGHDGSGDAEQ